MKNIFIILFISLSFSIFAQNKKFNSLSVNDIYGNSDNIELKDTLVLYDGTEMITAPIYKQVTVVSDSILVMFTRPQELIASPGVGKIIEIQHIAVFYDYGGTAYDKNGSSFLYYKYDGATSNYSRGSISIIEETSDSHLFAQCPSGDSSDSEDCDNKAVYITCDTANPITGNGDLKFYITYRIITL